ncbi:MAG: protein CpxP [Moritella dasanensis]|jgi:protein CpxP
MRSIKKMFSIVVVSAALVAVPLANASTTQEVVQTPLQEIVASLELTEDQKNEISSFIDKHQESRPVIDMEKVIQLKKEQLRLISQPKLDEPKLGSLIDMVQGKEKQLLMDEMRLKNNIYNVLTEDQKAKFKSSFKSLINV